MIAGNAVMRELAACTWLMMREAGARMVQVSEQTLLRQHLDPKRPLQLGGNAAIANAAAPVPDVRCYPNSWYVICWHWDGWRHWIFPN